jgi:phosphopantetheine adenylyltransferase
MGTSQLLRQPEAGHLHVFLRVNTVGETLTVKIIINKSSKKLYRQKKKQAYKGPQRGSKN